MRTILLPVAGAALLACPVGASAEKPAKPATLPGTEITAPAGIAAAPSMPALVTKLSPELVGSVLAGRNLRFETTTDSYGDPLIHIDVVAAGLPGEQLDVVFYDCQEAGCEDVTLWSWYDTPHVVDIDLINQWNATNRWAKAYLDEDKDAVLELDVNGTGGIGPDALDTLIGLYATQMTAFADQIGYAAAATPK